MNYETIDIVQLSATFLNVLALERRWLLTISFERSMDFPIIPNRMKIVGNYDTFNQDREDVVKNSVGIMDGERKGKTWTWWMIRSLHENIGIAPFCVKIAQQLADRTRIDRPGFSHARVGSDPWVKCHAKRISFDGKPVRRHGSGFWILPSVVRLSPRYRRSNQDSWQKPRDWAKIETIFKENIFSFK